MGDFLFILVPLLLLASIFEIFSLGLLIPLVESLLEVEQESLFSIYINKLLIFFNISYQSKFTILSILFILFYIIKTLYLTMVGWIGRIMIFDFKRWYQELI